MSAALMGGGYACGQATYHNIDETTGELVSATPVRAVVPYAFRTEDIGLAFGAAVAAGGWPQPQAFAMGTVFISDNDTKLVTLLSKDILIPGTGRLFVDPLVMVADWARLRIYAGYNPDYPDEVPGANDSSEFNYHVNRALEVWSYLDFAYVLPIGHGREHPISRYVVRDGLQVSGLSGGGVDLPTQSGRTLVRLRPTFRGQNIDNDWYREATGQEPIVSTLNYRLTLEYDNRDFIPNPERGLRAMLHFTHDPALLEETPDEWMTVEFDLAAYVPLPKPHEAKQSVLALNFWTVETPTWQEDSELRYLVDGAPPYFEGASLGGLFRLKAYPTGRFNSRSAIYYGAEYRIIPRWQPLPGIRWLESLDMKWWQFSLMGELGRVAPEYNIEELHTDMKWDVGAGLNIMFGSAVGRLNAVVGEEGFGVLVMAGHAY